MMKYEELVTRYQKRRHDTVVDSIATGLTYMDNVAIENGVLEETGILTELTESVCNTLPFVIIAATEGAKVVLGRKPAKTGATDGAYRMIKTGAALTVGAVVAGAAGTLVAIPATMGVRCLFDRYRSRALTGFRVRGRIERLHSLNEQIRSGKIREELEEKPLELPGEWIPADCEIK